MSKQELKQAMKEFYEAKNRNQKERDKTELLLWIIVIVSISIGMLLMNLINIIFG